MKNKKTRGPKGRRGAKGTVKDQCEYTSKIDYSIGMNIRFHYIVKKNFSHPGKLATTSNKQTRTFFIKTSTL